MPNLRILFLDVYKTEEFRINKDVNGGFGTGNNYGGSAFTKILAKFQKESIFWPPLYLASLIGVAEGVGHKCVYSTDLKDANINFDLFILSSSIVACETEISAVKELKKFKKPILVCGPFAATCHEKYFKAGANVILGEADTTFASDIKLFNELTFIPKKLKVSELNFAIADLPKPGWRTIFKHKKCKMGFLGSGPSLPIYASRGCPYSCFNYCTYPLQQGRKLRYLSINKLVDEIEFYKREMKVNSFLFRDPVFTINRNMVKDLCNEILKRKLKIVWGAELHLKDVDKELATIMAKAGLRIVFVGIESINPESIKKAKRQNAPPNQQLRAIKLLEGAGVSVKAMFIIGFPGDTKSNALETIKYAYSLPITYLQFSVFTPYPGTPIFLEYEKKIIAKKFENFTQWDLVFNHENLDNKSVKFLLDKSYSGFYFSIFRIIKIFYRLLKIELRKNLGIF
tara:strand:- start:785 stop:2152 length:1368 start_codon:yes stop_codon:yes gene_type:complete